MFRLCLLLTISVPLLANADDAPVSYAKEIRPILAGNCFACHGPDPETREADLRLDTFAGATARLNEQQAIKPTVPEKSLLLERVNAESEFDVMPPPETGKKLTPRQIDLLTRWIKQGAKFESHWAFEQPTQPEVPQVDRAGWNNPIDTFVLKQMTSKGLSPAPHADRHTLIRRVSLDLIGLPPTLKETEEFVNDDDPQAYQKLVDRLLASPQYGERWARRWLDLARYADTNGYEKDRGRSIWAYRDWVINALNDDMPFDEFSIKQLAGDMLPDATLNDQIATGFHRNTMLNEEGGIDPLEYRFYSMVDRVATTGTVWMGMTIGCAQCHTHKYDPITHTDYYSMLALLNNADEPDLKIPTPELIAQREKLQTQINALQLKLKDSFKSAEDFELAFNQWLMKTRNKTQQWSIIRPTTMSTNLPRLEVLDDGSIFSTGDITKRDVFQISLPIKDVTFPVTALRLEVLPDDRLPAGGPGRAFYEGRKGDFFLSELTAKTGNNPVQFKDPSHDFGKIAVGSGSAEAANVLDNDGSTGWSTATQEGESHQLVLNFTKPIQDPTDLNVEMIFERHFAASLGRFRFSVASSSTTAVASKLPVELESLCLKETQELSQAERLLLEVQFLETTPELAEARKPIDQLKNKLPEFPITMVFEERHPDNPRKTHRHHRGEYLNTEELVSPGIPTIFKQFTKEEPTNRLEFARWLVSDQNPLVGRAIVNRAWQAFFGRGFVNTLGDLGTQSELPTHPKLLDWLATEFTSSSGMNWSLKKLHRSIVLSNTYQQSSIITEDHLNHDPENLWLARGPRVRLEAEIIRDSALRVSGLLTKKIGGPSVYPPQPASVTALAYGNTSWTPSAGEDRYRRSLYTFSKRTSPFAAYTVFDAPTGESCIPQRDRSNTPLQALTLLNDQMYLEAARALANEIFDNAKSSAAMIEELIPRILTRPATQQEVAAIDEYFQEQLGRLKLNELQPQQILAVGAIENLPDHAAEIAAWTLTIRVLFNLDESVTKQ